MVRRFSPFLLRTCSVSLDQRFGLEDEVSGILLPEFLASHVIVSLVEAQSGLHFAHAMKQLSAAICRVG